MKLSNAQIATQMTAAYQRGDQEALVRMVDPAIEIHGEQGLINSGDYTGVDGFNEWTSAWEAAWDDTTYEIVQISEIGEDHVVAAVRVTGVGAGSRVPVKDVYGWLWEIRGGRATRFHTYVEFDTALRRAREFAGLAPAGEEEPPPAGGEKHP